MQYSFRERLKAYFQDIVTSQDVRRTMERLSSIGQVTLVLTDEDGRSVTCTREPGSPCSFPRHLLREQRLEVCSVGSCPRMQYQRKKQIVYRDEPLGMIVGCVSGPQHGQKASEIIDLLVDVVKEKLAAEYAVNSLSEEVLNTYEEINLQYELSEEMSAIFSTQQVCDIVLNKATHIIGAERAFIVLYDSTFEKFRVVAIKGIPDHLAGEAMVVDQSGVCEYVCRTQKPLLVEDRESLPGRVRGPIDRRGLEAFLSVPLLACPLKVKDRVIGMIGLSGKPFGQPYHSGHLKLLSSICSQAALSIYTSMLIRELKQNERIQKEMEIAEQIQRNLFPGNEKRIPGIDLAGRCIPARNVGGDYYDFFQKPGQQGVDIVVADISGHGIGAAIMMAMSRGILQSEALRYKSPSKLVDAFNSFLFQDLASSEHFLTMLYLSYCSTTKRLSFCNAGHTMPVVLRAGSQTPEVLKSEGIAIGVLEHISCEEKSIALCPGDLVVAYTDGLIEAHDPSGRQFGMDRFIETLKRYRQCDTPELIHRTLDAVLSYMGTDRPEYAQDDDITIVARK